MNFPPISSTIVAFTHANHASDVHFDDTKENNKFAEAAVNTSVNESLQLFKPKILNATEIIRDNKKKRPDIDTTHDYIMKTEASNVDKTLLENLVKELIRTYC